MSYNKPERVALCLCILAGIFYNTWPLGYILNSQTAHYGLASDLERVGQPYYGLFILGDVLTGISVVAACALLWFKLWPNLRSKIWAVVLLGLLAFGLFTAVGTIVPPQCAVASILKCGHDNSRSLGLDAFVSCLAAAGLFISLIGVSVLSVRYRLSAILTRTTQTLILAWFTSGLLFAIFAIDGGKANLLQQLFLTLSGLALLTIGLNISIAIRHILTKSQP